MRFNIDIPISDTARWITQDKDGTWWQWEGKPVPNDELEVWEYPVGYHKVHGCESLIEDAPPKGDWKQQIYKVIWS